MIAALIQFARPPIHTLIVHYDGYWRRFRWWWLAVAFAALADMLTTIRFMLAEGVEQELHPGIRIAAHVVGPVWGPLLGKLGQLAAIFLVTLYLRRLAPYIFFTAAFMYAWAAWYNTWGRDLYAPLLFYGVQW